MPCGVRVRMRVCMCAAAKMSSSWAHSFCQLHSLWRIYAARRQFRPSLPTARGQKEQLEEEDEFGKHVASGGTKARKRIINGARRVCVCM